MPDKELWQGNKALAEVAVRAGCRFFGGYPITPQTSIAEYLSVRLPQVGGDFVQVSSETSAINITWGASVAGARAMTATAGPGLSLMQEGLSGMAIGAIPAVIVDVQRSGAGTGGILPSQSDYNIVTRGLGHGGLHAIVLAPFTVQESLDLMYESFELAEKYRTLVFIMTDGMIGEMQETVEMPDFRTDVPAIDSKPWALSGAKGRKLRCTNDSTRVRSGVTNDINHANVALEAELEEINKLYDTIKKDEVRVSGYHMDDAEYVVIAYGTAARMAYTAIDRLREEGIKVGLFRPITLWPFPEKQLAELDDKKIKAVLSAELACPAQFNEDVRVCVNKKIPLYFYHRSGGSLISVEEYCEKVREIIKEHQ